MVVESGKWIVDSKKELSTIHFPLPTTWRQLIEEALCQLESAGVSEAGLNAEYLAMAAMNVSSRAALRANLDEIVTDAERKTFSRLVIRRAAREPLQYIIGEWEFFGLPLFVSKGALIPRPETEILVEESLAEANAMGGNITILDLGTGSGAIALALASRLEFALVAGIDKSDAALTVAEENRKRLDLSNVHFENADIMSGGWIDRFTHKVDLLVSNPPYVSLAEYEALEPELREHEPREALTDESTGLTFYQRIAEIAPKLLTPRGRLLVELGFGLAGPVSEIMRGAGMEVLRIADDLAGIPRVLVARAE